jgi:hypothetical protein
MVLKNEIYKTKSGKLLQVSAVRESGFHHFKEIDKEGNPVSDKRNSFGHVVHRTDLVYSEEIIKSFKKQKQCEK